MVGAERFGFRRQCPDPEPLTSTVSPADTPGPLARSSRGYGPGRDGSCTKAALLEGMNNSEINRSNSNPVYLVAWVTSDVAHAMSWALIVYSEEGLKRSAKAGAHGRAPHPRRPTFVRRRGSRPRPERHRRTSVRHSEGAQRLGAGRLPGRRRYPSVERGHLLAASLFGDFQAALRDDDSAELLGRPGVSSSRRHPTRTL